MGIKQGDEVITAANTAIPTISAIRSVGALPKLVDIGDDYLIDVSKIEREITKKTKAIIPISYHGLPCDIDELRKIGKNYNVGSGIRVKNIEIIKHIFDCQIYNKHFCYYK